MNSPSTVKGPAVQSQRLILHPRSAQAAPPDPAGLIIALREAGLLGESFSFRGLPHHRAGRRFLQHFAFLGCSPNVVLEATQDDGEPSFCHLRVPSEVLASVEFWGGRNVLTPRCPACRKFVEEWQSLLREWEMQGAAHRWTCPRCGQVAALPDLNWRQCAGFGRYFIEVWGIHEGEAAPSDGLLDALRAATGLEWGYFYYRE